MSQPDPTPMRSVSERFKDQESFRFFLVEDDDAHAELIRRHLIRERIQTELTRVNNGADALRYLRREVPYEDAERPDVVLLDLKLPKVDGLSVLKEVKNDPELARIPIIVLTTSDADVDRERAYSSHVNSYVVKPLDYQQFRQVVADLCVYWGVHNRRP